MAERGSNFSASSMADGSGGRLKRGSGSSSPKKTKTEVRQGGGGGTESTRTLVQLGNFPSCTANIVSSRERDGCQFDVQAWREPEGKPIMGDYNSPRELVSRKIESRLGGEILREVSTSGDYEGSGKTE